MKPKKVKKIKSLRGGALARAAVNQILLHPKTWDQNEFHKDCGTKHCFAGWCQILAGYNATAHRAWEDARYALRIDDAMAARLFDAGTTLKELYGFASTHEVPIKMIPFKE